MNHKPINRELNRITVCLCLWLTVILTQPKFARAEDDFGPRYGDAQPVYYEFGLKITSKGNSTGILGTVPIPIDWPEQTITYVTQIKTANLKNLTFKNLKSNIRQLILKSNRLGPGEVAQGTVIIRADKRFIEAPADKSKLLLAKTIPSKIKQYLRPSPYIECNDKKIKTLAQQIEFSNNATAWEHVETIYQWVRDNIEYKFDSQIHSCLDALDSGIGDCEEMSSLFIAICRAKGIPARAVWIPGHTYPEFYLVDEKKNGYWFPCQVAGTYQFGTMSEPRPILQKGDRFKMPGAPKPLRYIQPTLVAKNASGGLAIEFIAREITDPNEIDRLATSSRD